jgi:ABC-2 type transport system ATP-binding protein
MDKKTLEPRTPLSAVGLAKADRPLVPFPVDQPVVVLDNVVKRFGDFLAVDHISLSVRAGEIFGFLGPNGSGKSTTIRMLCGLLRPSAGSGRVYGLDIVTQSEQIKTQLGYMSQKFSLYTELRVEENLAFYGNIYGLNGSSARKRITEVLKLIGLHDRRLALTRDLPSGLRQRLALGCALLHEPPLLFLDEPTSGVDPATRRNFWDLIYALADKGVTVFVTTHYMEEAEYCHRIALIDRGRLIALGSPAELKSNYLRGRIYEVEADDILSAVEALPKADPVLDAAIFGRSLHVRLTADTEAQTYLQPLFTSAGLTLTGLKPIEPTLEDVFVALVGANKEAPA